LKTIYLNLELLLLWITTKDSGAFEVTINKVSIVDKNSTFNTFTFNASRFYYFNEVQDMVRESLDWRQL